MKFRMTQLQKDKQVRLERRLQQDGFPDDITREMLRIIQDVRFHSYMMMFKPSEKDHHKLQRNLKIADYIRLNHLYHGYRQREQEMGMWRSNHMNGRYS